MVSPGWADITSARNAIPACLARCLTAAVLLGAAALHGCGGGGGSSPPAPLTIAPTAVTLDAGMSKTFVASGGTAPYTFSLDSGSGTVTSSGTYSTAGAGGGSADVRVTDSGGQHADATVTIDAALAFAPGATTLDGGQTLALAGTGGQGPYTYSVVSGPGTVNASTGLFTAPATAGSTVVQVTDVNGGSAQITITNNATLGISPAAVTLDAGMSKAFIASGGTPPYTFSLLSGTGTVTAAGTYTTPAAPGTGDVRVTDAIGQHVDAIVTIDSALGFAPGPTVVDGGLNLNLSGTGGQGPYTYAVVSGPGTVNPSTGLFTAPTTAGSTVVQVTDANGGTSQITITNYATLGITPSSITVTAGSGETLQFSGTGGSGSYAYTLVSGPGTLSATGLYTAANASGTSVVRVTDSLGISASASVRTLRIRVNGPVAAAVTDGTSWYVGGSFTAVNPYSAPRLILVDATSGNPQLGCDLQSGFLNGTVSAIATSATAIYVGGQFDHYRGIPASNLVKIDPVTCALDPVFNQSGGLGDGMASGTQVGGLLLSGNSLYVSGAFNVYRGTSVGAVIKLDATTGNLDPNFAQTAGQGFAGPLALSGNNLYVGGSFVTYDGAAVAHLAKVDATTGHVDPTFGGGSAFDSAVFALAVSGSSLYAGGVFTHYGSTPANVAKLDLGTGALDPVFTAATLGYDGVYALAIAGSALYIGRQPNGQTISGVPLAKVDATTGATDNAFTQPYTIDQQISTIAVSNGAMYIGGFFQTYRGQVVQGAAKIDPTTGALDTTFTQPTGVNGQVADIAFSGSNVVIGGLISTYRGTPAPHLAKFDIQTDTPDPTFLALGGANSPVSALTLFNGALYAGGAFTTLNGTAASGVAKLDPASGVVDTGFAPGAIPQGNVILAYGGALYVGGQSSAVVPSALVKVDPATAALDPTFAANGPVTGLVGALVTLGTSLYVGGQFSTYGSNPALNLAKVDATTGALDQSFTQATGISGGVGGAYVNALAATGSAVYVGGGFGSYRGTAVQNIAKVDATSGALDTTFTLPSGFTAPNSWLATLLISASSLYAGGQFATYRTADAENLAKLDAVSGVLDTTFTQTPGVCDAGYGQPQCGGWVTALGVAGSRLYVGSYAASSYRGQPAYYFFPVDLTSGAALDP